MLAATTSKPFSLPNHPCSVLLRIIYNIYSEGKDDTYANFTEKIFMPTIKYLYEFEDHKLLSLLWILISNINWTVGVDKELLERNINKDSIKTIFES